MIRFLGKKQRDHLEDLVDERTTELFEEEHRQRQLAESLQEISTVLNSSLDQNSVLTKIMEQLGRVMKYDKACVFLQKQEALAVCSWVGGAVSPLGLQILLSDNCPTIRVFKQRTPLVIPDVRTEPHWLEEPGEIPIQSWMGVPLLTGEDAIGVLSIESCDVNTYQEEDIKVLQAYANHAAIAIRNAQLYQELTVAYTELQRKNAQLEELNVSKDKFFSIISHDLKSPFTVMLTFSQLLVQELEHRKEKHLTKMAHKLQTYAEKFYTLLENLLTWSQMQQGAMPWKPTTLDLLLLVEQSIKIFLQKAEHKGITLKSTISEQITVYADCSMVNTVIRNLLSNALKFTEAGGEITISARSQEAYVEMTVSDTGCGIDQNGLTNLFRIDKKYIKEGIDGEKGTGLGLILCKDMVEQNGGKIWVESTVGLGTRLKFTLPKSPQSEA